MSPIPPAVTAFAHSSPTPSLALDPGSVGQPATTMSYHVLGTGGLVFAVVAIVSVAGYFYHGRGAATASNNTRTNNPWTSLTSFFSSIRHRGSVTTKATAADWPVDLEVGPEHVSMVYARFFHPTFWNLVECHPATPSTPAICVEEEAEVPVAGPKPFGMNSFLSMNDDDGDRDDDPESAHENESSGHGAGTRVERIAPYDTSSPTRINFNNEIIGTTVRKGTFLSIPGEREVDSPETSSTDSKLDCACSPYDGGLTIPSYDGSRTSNYEPDFICSPYDGILATPSTSSDALSMGSFDSEFDSPYDGILTTPPESSQELSAASFDGSDSCLPYLRSPIIPKGPSPGSRRYGMADMADLAQTLKVTIREEDCSLGPTISQRVGLRNVLEPTETEAAFHSADDGQMVSTCNIGAPNSRDDVSKSPIDTDGFLSPQEGQDLMRRLLEELRDPNMDFTPRAFFEDSDSEYSEQDEDKERVSCFTPPCDTDGMSQISLESDSVPTSPGSDSDVTDEGLVYPLTPPPKCAAFDDRETRISLEVVSEFNEVNLVLPTSLYSPPSPPPKAHVRSRRDTRSYLYGPRSPLVELPRL